MIIRIASIAAVLGALTAPAASALTVTNEADETIHIWIENRIYRLRQERTTRR
jgi:ABC-type glycerol-3-phosphate transport system substrate-binding protein